ncbi:MAG: hypothetical protein U5Q16_07475, partial [Gammaproteobacteria bacterium]|nr:hypothetical protein [Gammaproteobacteria bacterium]
REIRRSLMTDARLFGIAVSQGNHRYAQLVETGKTTTAPKPMARQAAGFVALREAEHELAEADKLNSFSQVSAFVVHDVKTIAAQLSLLVENAGRHKGNPAFVDDMVSTVGDALLADAPKLLRCSSGRRIDRGR